MDISVKHNNVTITSSVINYNREHNICSSIGTLDITLKGTYTTQINPWDTFDIYENGSFQVRYYVSQAGHSVPEGVINVQCQDKSKRLIDYFIPDTYTIDYPSYTRYWIEKFLAEAGISYSFVTSSQGNLLSNYTTLGLQSGYDQIMMLLQLSGWYMYFNGNGIAIIGSLDTDLAGSAGSINKTDIIEIKRITDDKMLRNRAVVWGQFDPLRQEFAFADVSTHTRWNYSHDDLRTMVISNNNIPTKDAAFGIANKLVKEFAKVTVEKHILMDGARDYSLGEMLRVSSDVWRGKGMITTFSVSMDRSGLTTFVILDQRCPRLFGFFNFGDYVYVGTFGDGVWRKHIRFDPTFYNFSTGLTDLNITDLHINNGIFGAVSHSGGMFYASNELGPWYPITVDSLESSKDDVPASGGSIILVPYSGIQARATIVDKITNTVKFGVDNDTRLNYGDYFLEYSGYFRTTTSGILSSGQRGWIVEYDAYDGAYIETSYPISYSGNYNIVVIDLENNGANDYVSVRLGNGGELIPYSGVGFNFGYRTSQPAHTTYDNHTFNSYNTLDVFSGVGDTTYGSFSTQSTASTMLLSIFDNEALDEREVIFTGVISLSLRFGRKLIYNIGGSWTSSTLTSPPLTNTGNLMAITKMSNTIYRLYHYKTGGVSPVVAYPIYYRDWDTVTNTVGNDVLCTTLTFTRDATKLANNRDAFGVADITINNITYLYFYYIGWAGTGTTTDISNFMRIYGAAVDITTGSTVFSQLLHDQPYTPADGTSEGHDWNIHSLTASLPFTFWLYQNGISPALGFAIAERNETVPANTTVLRNYFLYSKDGINFTNQLVQETNVSGDPAFIDGTGPNHGGAQVTNTHVSKYYKSGTNNTTYIFNGDILSIVSKSSIPYQWISTNITPIFGSYDDNYVAKNGSNFFWCNPSTLEPSSQLTIPANYTIIKVFSTSSSYQPMYYVQCTNTLTNDMEILRYLSSMYTGYSIKTGLDSDIFDQTKGFIVGNFFIDYDGGTSANWLYIGNTDFPNTVDVFMVLQRSGTDFSLIQESYKPIRIDISNSNPVLTVRDLENTFQSNFIYGNILTQIIPTSGLLSTEVRDYRYTLLETNNGIITSGVAAFGQAMYVNASGIYIVDLSTYSGGFILFDTISSGEPSRIETSNYVYPSQYLFVTSNGEFPSFYQKDNDGLFFDLYSGLPQSRATIIRLDDRF